jgi:poly(A) polymerase/tRNA nucleotidyltransferase (CCA-adding enzyme)
MELKLPPIVDEVFDKLTKAGFQAFLVGGSVRDLILARSTHDWDFTTNATPAQIQEVFGEKSFYNNSFGTVGVNLEEGETVQITPFRKEAKYSDHRHPDKVEWAETLEEDLARRELTINSLAYSDKLIDPFGGQNDLKNKIIRAVGNPTDRFNEDALRMLRAIRFATQLGFLIENETFLAIKQNAVLLQKISGERIRDEVEKIFSSDFPADGVRLLSNSGLLQYILPELVRGIGVSQKGTHHADDVFTHSLKALQFCQNKNWVVRLATLLHDVGKPATFKERNGKATFYNHETIGGGIARDIANRLHFTKEDREKLYMLVRWHMFTVSEFITDAAVRRFIRRVGAENTTDMLDLRTADRVGSGVKPTSWRHEEFKRRIIKVQQHIPSVNDLAIDGNDVMQILGIGPGPQIGRILNILFEEITEDPSKNNREYLITKIKTLT